MIRDRSAQYTYTSFDALIGLRGLGRIAKQLVTAVLAALVIKSFALESFYIPSTSMSPTLHVDDCILVPKLTYGLRVPFSRDAVISWSNPTRGEVVVFNREDDPTTLRIDESARTMVKRVIGLPGDQVAIRGSQVFVNGEPLTEPYARWQRGGVSEEQTFTVPEHALFMLGDNRDESYDSRFWAQPFVRSQRVVGPVAAVYWSQAQARG